MDVTDFLSPGERYLALLIIEMEQYIVSELTDKVDAALARIQADESDKQARIDAGEAARKVLQAQVDALQAGNDVDEAELRKVIETLDAIVPVPTPAPVDPEPTPDPAAPVGGGDTPAPVAPTVPDPAEPVSTDPPTGPDHVDVNDPVESPADPAASA